MENKRTKGRQKIEMKMIEDEGYRLISFSKRRTGIYKKASELSILCGVNVSIIFFSPSGKPYTFATSSIQDGVDRFMKRALPVSDDTTRLLEAGQRFKIKELGRQYNILVAHLKAKDEREELLKRVARARHAKGWWEKNIDELSLSELERFGNSIEAFQNVPILS